MKKSLFLIIIFILLFNCTAKKELKTPVKSIDQPKYLWVFQPKINIRNNNSTSSRKIGELNDGDSVLVTQNKNGWYRIAADNGKSGWIRTDLLGPRNLSIFLRAEPFIEQLKNKENIQIYFDKKLEHRCIYISYPGSLYKSKEQIKDKTHQLIRNYQKHVYNGDVTAHVLKHNSKDIFVTVNLQGELNADPKLPVLPFGRIEKVDKKESAKISLTIFIPDDITKNQLLKTARQLVSVYPISYSEVQVLFYHVNQTIKEICYLWYQEDKHGEHYQFNKKIKY